jgi:hypothetical protein
MIRSARLDAWLALAEETANLVRDYRDAMVVDADHAVPSLPIRIAAVRGQVNVISAKSCPVGTAWEAAADYLPIARMFVDDASPPALRLQLVDRVVVASERLSKALTEGERTRADVFG